MITIKDIAAEAGVSKSTVSRVLTNKGYVNEDTRKRIILAMEKHGYQPSEMARSLSMRSSRAIGIIVPQITNDFYSEILQGISEQVDKNQFSLIYCNTIDNTENEAKALDMLQRQRVCGIILALANDDPVSLQKYQILDRCKKVNAPVVFLDRVPEDTKKYDYVRYDNYGASYRAAEELIRGGCRTLGIITGDMKLRIGQERFEGWRQALKDNHVEVESKYIQYGDFSYKTAYNLSCVMLGSSDRPEGVVTCNNVTTLGFLRRASELGLKFGKDICFVGIDHITVLDTINYRYSCVGRDAINMGRIAMQLCMEKISHPEMPRRTVTVPYDTEMRGTEKKNPEI